MRIRWQECIAGTRSRLGGAYPALAALNSTSDVLGPGRMHSVRETLINARWPDDSTQGEFVVEGAADKTDTGTWAELARVAWSAGGKTDQVRITGSHMNLRCRATIVINGTGGLVIDAQGNE